MRALLRAALAVGLLWAGVVALALGFRFALIYPFPYPNDGGEIDRLPGRRVVSLAAADGTPLTVWIADPRQGRPVIVHFTGNAGWLAAGATTMRAFAEAGYGVAILGYRGAGGLPGAPREADLIADGVALLDALPMIFPGAPGPPIVYGTSLGAALAVQVATRRPAAALVLEAPFSRLCDAAEHAYPILPACFVMWDERWDSLVSIREVSAPVLVLHGEADRVIPAAQGKRLFDEAQEPKQLMLYPDGRHNDLRLHGASSDTLAWLETLILRPTAD